MVRTTLRPSARSPGDKGSTGWHYHPLTFQVVYCLRGWEEIAFEDGTLVRTVPGTCVNVPPGVGHNEIGDSDDLGTFVLSRRGRSRAYDLRSPDRRFPAA
jgi:uncharacterized protein YjlB